MTLLRSLVGAVLLTDAPEDVQLRAHDDTWLLVEYLRTDRGRRSLERPEPLPEGDLT